MAEDPAAASGFLTPAGDQLPPGLDNVLAAQAMFPVTSAVEMAGQPGENPIADAAAAGDLGGPNGVWELLAARLRQIPEYVELFQVVFDDVGERVSGDAADRCRFRVPSLRNVALTGSWGHAGAYNTLEAVVRHQLDPVTALRNYDPSQAVLPSRRDLNATDFAVMNDPYSVATLAELCELEPVALSDEEIADLLDFLHALTDPSMLDLRAAVPQRVPSGLPVFD